VQEGEEGAGPQGAAQTPPAAPADLPSLPRAQKKRAKKPPPGAAQEPADGCAPAPPRPASPSDEARYSRGVEQLRGGALWCALSGCGVTDKRCKALCDALRGPGVAVTDLDLSGNRLSDAGASLLAAALGGGLAPDLILLNVAGNPLTETGRAALQSLQRLRRGLDVTFTALDQMTPPATAAPPPKGAATKAGKLARSERGSLGSIASRYFGASAGGSSQPCEAEQEERRRRGGGGGGGAQDGGECERLGALEAAQAALSAASSAVAASAAGDAGALDAPRLGAALFAALAGVEEELGCEAGLLGGAACEGGDPDAQPPLGTPFPRLAALPPATLTLAQGAEVLVAVLTLAPPRLAWQGADKRLAADAALRAGAGTHRVAVLQLLARLLSLRCVELDEVLAGCGAAAHSVELLFACTCGSPAHVAALALLRHALRSPVARLCQPLVCGQDSLQARLAEAGTAAAVLTPGRRMPHIGVVVALANALAAVQSGGGEAQRGVRAALDADQRWAAFCQGPLLQLNAEQQGSLCGPKPCRPQPLFSGAGLAAMPGGNGLLQLGGVGGNEAPGAGGGFGGLMSGRELLSLLQNFGRMNMTTAS